MSSNTSSDNTKAMSSAKTATKATATKKTTEVAAPVAPVAAAAATKATKTTKKATEVVAPAPVAAPVVETAAVVAAVPEEDIGATLQKAIADLHEQLTNVKAAISTAANALKSIEKQAARVVKKSDRRRKGKKAASAEGGAPKSCIFTKPVRVSDELCAFLGKEKGTEFSRAAVTKSVIAYARSHNLMDKQAIKADAALRKLLALKEGDNLTILSLQKFLSRHYVKAAPVAN